jgi:hypothetical protein
VLLRRTVPGYVVEIMTYGCVLEFFSIANNSVEISFRRGDEICVVH